MVPHEISHAAVPSVRGLWEGDAVGVTIVGLEPSVCGSE